MRTTTLETKPDLAISCDIINAADSLQQSLRALTDRLKYLSTSQGIDVVLIGQTADAIAKVSQALILVRQLEQNCW